MTGTAAGSNMGFIEGFSLIFMSELGDKTFFIAALLAMKVGKAVSFFGSTAALTVMTVISVSIGVMCAQVPAFIHSSIPVGGYLGAALLVFFGTHFPSLQFDAVVRHYLREWCSTLFYFVIRELCALTHTLQL